MSVCAKLQLPSSSRSCWKVGGFQVITVSDLNPSDIELELGLGFDNCNSFYNMEIMYAGI